MLCLSDYVYIFQYTAISKFKYLKATSSSYLKYNYYYTVTFTRFTCTSIDQALVVKVWFVLCKLSSCHLKPLEICAIYSQSSKSNRYLYWTVRKGFTSTRNRVENVYLESSFIYIDVDFLRLILSLFSVLFTIMTLSVDTFSNADKSGWLNFCLRFEELSSAFVCVLVIPP